MARNALRACFLCAASSLVALVAIAACDTSFTIAPGNGEGGAASGESGAPAGGDGAVTTDGAGGPQQDGGSSSGPSEGGGVPDGGTPPLGNVDCQSLKSDPSVLFCADFEGSFPYGFSTAMNNASITQTSGTPNGKPSKVFDFQLASGMDAGTTVTQLAQAFPPPQSGSFVMDADIRIVTFGLLNGAIAALVVETDNGMPAELGVAVVNEPGKTTLVALPAGKIGAAPGTTWHHLRVIVEPTTQSVLLDQTMLASSALKVTGKSADVVVGLYEVTPGPSSGPTELQIDNVVVRAL